ncbi:hypothetical protein RJ55_00758 [Drechmeria coniospora]|nr:hypothetical protein RJ55_00758 [Drechmeria coniospora]
MDGFARTEWYVCSRLTTQSAQHRGTLPPGDEERRVRSSPSHRTNHVRRRIPSILLTTADADADVDDRTLPRRSDQECVRTTNRSFVSLARSFPRRPLLRSSVSPDARGPGIVLGRPFPSTMRSLLTLSALLAVASLTIADDAPPRFSIDSQEAIRRTAGTVAWDMMQYYKGNLSGATPGILPGPPPAGDYYWWEAGAMWGTLIDYWAWTGDATYNDEVMTAMQWQVGPGRDYQPPNVTASLGNDDQAFWGMSAMLAAESRFPDPPADRPQWLALAQAVFNTQAAPDRHDQDCGGGMHWQIYSFNTGYDYKNSIANGCFFNLGARLYRYTGNETYRDWAVRTWDWMEAVGYLDAATYAIYDGAHGKHNCTDINMAEFSYNNAVFAQGAAFLYNATEDAVWKARTERLVSHGLKTFFPEGVAVELPCEKPGTCTTDMLSFKGFLHRWYAVITQMVPSTSASIAPMLAKSAAASIRQCTGGAFGRQCGFQWATGTYDGRTGVSQQMSVLGAVLSQLIGDAKSPVTAKSGGTSKGDPNAGARSSLGESCRRNDRPVTVGDRVGAGMLTFALVALATGLFGWIIMDIRDS